MPVSEFNINILNSGIILFSILIIIFCIVRIIRYKKENKIHYYVLLTIVYSLLTIIQVLLIDIGITKKYPLILGFYLPFQFLAPIYYTKFNFNYLGLEDELNKKIKWYWIPFWVYFIIYQIFKINAIFDFTFINEHSQAYFSAEWDENLALIFSFIMAIINYNAINNYENKQAHLPHITIRKQTYWLKNIFYSFIILNILWFFTIVILKVFEEASGNSWYYPLWIFHLVFYLYLYFSGLNKLPAKIIESINNGNDTKINQFQLSGLNHDFEFENIALENYENHKLTHVLSYFASSLFDKNNTEDILWDIAENCISKIGLEDCVIYQLDPHKKSLIQKAAYGNKGQKRKILSPLEIKMGEGVVGKVAESGNYQLINNIQKINFYIKDDKERSSELAVPIFIENQLFGVLDSEHSNPNFFNEEHLMIFQLIARLIGKKLKQIENKNISVEINHENSYFKELIYLFEETKWYKDPNLSLNLAAERLNISSNYLSQIINKIGGVGFVDLLNKYRVEEAAKNLIDSEFSAYTVTAIGLESGFNSKSAFYSSFKKFKGVSPAEYRKQNMS